MIRLKAHAKVNLGLAITAKRPDGFHDIDTIFARLDVHDGLKLKPQASGINLSIEGADLPVDKTNLVYKAAETYLEQLEHPKGVSITLRKRIPIAAGLGGGSSDAAATLRALSQLYPANINIKVLAETLGSDVPFFLRDVPAAHAQGRGEILEPLDLPKCHLVLVNPGLHISAKEAYQLVTKLQPVLPLAAIVEALQAKQDPPYFNGLQTGILEHYSSLAEVITALKQVGLRGVMMSGSGSTCFGLAKSKEAAQAAAQELKNHKEWWVKAAYTC